MIIECNAPLFRGLKNPYTGQPITVKMLVTPNSEPMFFAPDTYSTAAFMATATSAVEHWNRVDGVRGLKDTSGLMKCAYTGEPLSLSRVEGKWYFVGGFNPNALTTRDEFLYYVSMRDGVPSDQFPEVTKLTRATCVDMEPHVYETEEPVEQTTESENLVADMIEKLGDKSGCEKKTIVRGASLPKRGKK